MESTASLESAFGAMFYAFDLFQVIGKAIIIFFPFFFFPHLDPDLHPLFSTMASNGASSRAPRKTSIHGNAIERSKKKIIDFFLS